MFACLTCNPAPATESDTWTPAGVCYSCSVQCHGEHTLVEIFQKRNFTCDCGTKRLPATSPCALQINETNTRGNVHSQEPDVNNKYNKNFRNRFCACDCDYDPFEQKGTMFQCLGLGTEETGGCGEDWYHPGCLVSMGPKWFEKMAPRQKKIADADANGNGLAVISEANEDEKQPEKEENKSEADEEYAEEEDPPMPPGFPEEEDFDGFLCYKCVESNPWIKQYAGTSGFLPAVHLEPSAQKPAQATSTATGSKRKADAAADDDEEQESAKRVKTQSEAPAPATTIAATAALTEPTGCKLPNLPAVPAGRFSLFLKEDFREKFCRCSDCFPKINAYPQLLEEEEVYEPPMSDDGDASQNGGGSTAGSGSLLERGESALRNVDRVRAIEGVMAYNHLKERLKPFFQQFADSGQAIGAEDIKAYFAKLRGDEEAIKEAGENAAADGSSGAGGDSRREQGGY